MGKVKGFLLPCRASGTPRLLVLASCVLLAGCATAAPNRNLFCDLGPARPTQNDVTVISDGLASYLLTVNETGERLCRWKP